MFRKYFVSSALLIALLASPVPSVAQQTAAGEAGQVRAMVAQFEPAAYVSIRLKDGSRIKGTVMGSNENTFTVKPRTRIPVAARDLAFDDVVSLERSHIGMSPGKKVLLGTGLGVGGFLLVLAALIGGMAN